MDVVIRVIAIFIEVVILATISYAVLNGVLLTFLDLGAGAKYKKAVAMVLTIVGVILVVFFIAHLTTFYPSI